MGGRTRRGLTRRALLGTLAALPVAACTSDPGPPPPPDPDDVLREAAAERERSLLRQYDAVLLSLPSLAATLTPLRAEHVEHLAALTGAAGSSAPPAEPAPAASAAGAGPAVPPATAAAAALRSLAAAERAVAAAHGDGCLQASRPLAGLLASLSASEHSHPVVLR